MESCSISWMKAAVIQNGNCNRLLPVSAVLMRVTSGHCSIHPCHLYIMNSTSLIDDVGCRTFVQGISCLLVFLGPPSMEPLCCRTATAASTDPMPSIANPVQAVDKGE